MIIKMKSVIIIAVIISTVATFGIFRYLQAAKSKGVETEPAFQDVVVIKTSIPLGTRLDDSNIREVEWPRELVPQGSYRSIADISGRVSKIEMYQGEVVLESKLAPQGSESGFSSIIPTGMRALTVEVNNYSGVGGFILPNTRVDVLVTVPSHYKQEESTTKIILENIQVLAVDQIYEREKDDPVTVQTVTLLVTPEQAEKLVLASTEGKLQLSLRNTADSNVALANGIKLKDLIAPKANPAPRRTRSTPVRRVQKDVIEVIRSNERLEVTFENGEMKQEKKL